MKENGISDFFEFLSFVVLLFLFFFSFVVLRRLPGSRKAGWSE